MSLRGLCVFACSFFALTGAFRQSTTASMLGVVHDPSGAVIPNAEVTATDTQTTLSRTTQTDGAGSYLITNLPIGQYQLRVVAPGFRRLCAERHHPRRERKRARRRHAEDWKHHPDRAGNGGIHRRGHAHRRRGRGRRPERIQELPLNGRNAMQLCRCGPRCHQHLAAPPVQTQSRSGPSITVSGGRDTQNEFRFDGVSWKNITQNTAFNLPNPDALQEFQILTSSPSAEYGRYSGGIILAVTRSGSNQFHGTA